MGQSVGVKKRKLKSEESNEVEEDLKKNMLNIEIEDLLLRVYMVK